MQPTVVGDLKWVKTSYTSIHGEIVVGWERKGNLFRVQVSLPEQVSALVVMPDGKQCTVSGSTKIQCVI